MSITPEEIYKAFLPLTEMTDRDHFWFLNLTGRARVAPYLSSGDASCLRDGDLENMPKFRRLAELLDSVSDEYQRRDSHRDQSESHNEWLNEGLFPGQMYEYASGEELIGLLADILSEFVVDADIGLPNYQLGHFSAHRVSLDTLTKHLTVTASGFDGPFMAALLYGTMETQQDEYFEYHMLEGIGIDKVIQLGTGYQLLPFRHLEASLDGIYPSSRQMNGLTVLRITKSVSPIFSDLRVGNRLQSSDTFPIQPPMDVSQFCEVLSLISGRMVRQAGSWTWTTRTPNVWDCPPYGRTVHSQFPHEGVIYTSGGQRIAENSIRAAMDLYSRYLSLDLKSKRKLQQATRRWAQSTLFQPEGDDLIDLRIALECLFTPDNNLEVAYRLSHRAAWWTFDEPIRRIEARQTVNKVYGLASGVIHGNPRDTNHETQRQINDVRDWTRRGIVKSVYCGGYKEWDELVCGSVADTTDNAHAAMERLLSQK